ncbi:hypothetical protein [Agromyces silvae]|uniref:hypothetical protein n=1 Tax=Agromyces silvae TaxID=3388266 RepID=UPI00280BCB50|nr:hypothetical protein [Agromyces protaetiae]
MFSTLLSGLMTTTVLLAGVTPADTPEKPIDISAAAVTVEADVKTMPHFWASTSFGELKCPGHAPFLEDRKYANGVPPGLEVRTFGGDGVRVASVTKYHSVQRGRPIGIAYATVTNWAVPTTERTVQLVAHCVSS